MNFIRRLEETFIFQAPVVKLGDLLREKKLATNANIQRNISIIMPAGPKDKGHGDEYHF